MAWARVESVQESASIGTFSSDGVAIVLYIVALRTPAVLEAPYITIVTAARGPVGATPERSRIHGLRSSGRKGEWKRGGHARPARAATVQVSRSWKRQHERNARPRWARRSLGTLTDKAWLVPQCAFIHRPRPRSKATALSITSAGIWRRNPRILFPGRGRNPHLVSVFLRHLPRGARCLARHPTRIPYRN